MKSPHIPQGAWLRTAPPSSDLAQKQWLFRRGALTAGLRQLGKVELRVLAEYSQGAPADEALAMRLRPGAPVWVREVVMSIDGTDCVVARSLAPLPASRAVWQGMRRLRTRPLADMLYHDRSVQRSAFVCRRLGPGIPFHKIALAAARAADDPGTVLARRSVFWRNGAPLLVAEGFLPAFWRRAARKRITQPD